MLREISMLFKYLGSLFSIHVFHNLSMEGRVTLCKESVNLGNLGSSCILKIQYNTIQHTTIKHNTRRYSTIPYCRRLHQYITFLALRGKSLGVYKMSVHCGNCSSQLPSAHGDNFKSGQ